jgi:ABC-type sugar transport system permease subunit
VLKTRPWVPYLYVAPAVALLALVFAYPVVKVVDFSTKLVRGSNGPRVGLQNYRLVFDDPTFRDAAKHSALLLLAVPVLVTISLLVSVLLYERLRGWKVYRSILFMPYILAVPIVGIIASYLFALNGAINSILRAVGLGPLALDWLGSERIALWTVMIVIVWREVGFGIILFLARLLSLSEEQLEAARIDGAGWWARLRYVIVPELRGTIEFYVVVASITMLAWIFAYVYTLTSGGPGTSTTILELYIYNQGLRNSLPGMASAVAVLLLGATIVLIGIRFWLTSRERDEEVGTA